MFFPTDLGHAEIRWDGPRATLLLDGVESSAVDASDPSYLEFEYMQHMSCALGAALPPPGPVRALHLGGAACALACAWEAARPGSRQVCVEVDALLAQRVREHFPIPRSPRVRIRVGDGRAVVDAARPGAWDVVVRDAFVGGAVPEHLRTRECAAAVAADWDGVLPSSRDDLLTLPGVGPYTADAVIAFSYRKRSVVLDTNTRRVLCRLHGAAAPPSHLRKDEIARADAMVPLEDDLAWQWNAALMELGALVCTAKNPACQECPLRPDCAWFAAGKPESGTPRRVQRFTGTHREARGKIMAVLRGAASPVSRDELAAAASLAPSRFDPALDSLLDDGLACLSPGGYALPGER
mgnify:FL=1